MPTINGNYAVVVTKNGCKDTSTCYTVNDVGIPENGSYVNVIVYPNPSAGVFTVRSEKAGFYRILNELGESVHEVKLDVSNKYTVNVADLANGIYFMIRCNDGQITRTKIVVTR